MTRKAWCVGKEIPETYRGRTSTSEDHKKRISSQERVILRASFFEEEKTDVEVYTSRSEDHEKRIASQERV